MVFFAATLNSAGNFAPCLSGRNFIPCFISRRWFGFMFSLLATPWRWFDMNWKSCCGHKIERQHRSLILAFCHLARYNKNANTAVKGAVPLAGCPREPAVGESRCSRRGNPAWSPRLRSRGGTVITIERAFRLNGVVSRVCPSLRGTVFV